jgi:hypothetical protein
MTNRIFPQPRRNTLRLTVEQEKQHLPEQCVRIVIRENIMNAVLYLSVIVQRMAIECYSKYAMLKDV